MKSCSRASLSQAALLGEGPASQIHFRGLFAQTPLYVFAEDDGLRHFLHRFAALAALPLNCQIRLFLGNFKFPLQNSFRAFHDFPRLQFFG